MVGERIQESVLPVDERGVGDALAGSRKTVLPLLGFLIRSTVPPILFLLFYLLKWKTAAWSRRDAVRG